MVHAQPLLVALVAGVVLASAGVAVALARGGGTAPTLVGLAAVAALPLLLVSTVTLGPWAAVAAALDLVGVPALVAALALAVALRRERERRTKLAADVATLRERVDDDAPGCDG